MIVQLIRYSTPVTHDPSPETIQRVALKTFPKNPADKIYQANSYEHCASFCRGSVDCGGFSFTPSNRICRIVVSPDKYIPSATDNIGLKFQKLR